MNPLSDIWKGRSFSELIRMVYFAVSFVTMFVGASAECLWLIILAGINLILATAFILSLEIEE